MDSMTAKARNEIEKIFSPQEALEFLKVKDNFRFVSNGIKEQLIRLGYSGDDDALLMAFRNLMRDERVGSEEGRCEGEWFRDEVLPSKEFSIKMCFAFKLSSISKPKTATEFLWSVCRINGFNYRIAEDIIYNYALEHDECYEYAKTLIERYESTTADVDYGNIDKTKSTMTLSSIFRDLADMDEDTFIKALIENKKDFIGYNKTSRDEFLKVYNGLTDLIIAEINETNTMAQTAGIPGYTTGNKKSVKMYSEIIFMDSIRKLIAARKQREKKLKRNVLIDILDKFPIERYILNMKSEAKKNRDRTTDLGHGYARKTFILCFFAKYILEWQKAWDSISNKKPVSFFNDFYRRLDSALRRCSYGALYPAHPFDWLILKCVKACDETNYDEEDIMEHFNEILSRLGDNQDI